MTELSPVRTAAEGSPNPAGALLRGAAWPMLTGVVVLTLAAVVVSLSAAASVLVGGVMAVLALVAAPALHQLCRSLDPNLVLGIVVFAYCVVVVLLWVAYSLVVDASWLSGGWAGSGVLVAGIGWVSGHMRAALKLRQPLYEDGASTAGR